MARIEAITVPKWGLTMSEGTVSKWLVEPGQDIALGDAVMEMETSKIVNDVEAIVAGVLRRQVAQDGDMLPIGALLGVVADPDVSDSEIDAFIAGFVPVDIDGAEASAAPSPRPSAAADDSACNATVHARRFALAHGIDLTTVSGSGRGGRISVEDVEAVIVAAGGSLAAQTPVERVPQASTSSSAAENRCESLPLGGMRKTIAARLQASTRDAPHFRVSVDVEVDALLARRAELNAGDPAARVTLNDLLIKACATALLEVPDCNVQFDGETIHRFADADIAVAVTLDGGLITPIVRRANRKTVAGIAEEMRDLAARAKAGRLKPGEFEGGTFSLSNLGMFGVRQFDAIINPPQAAILAVGAAEPRVVVREGQPAVATVMTLSLACDHRVIDGALAARFLKALKSCLEHPANADHAPGSR